MSFSNIIETATTADSRAFTVGGADGLGSAFALLSAGGVGRQKRALCAAACTVLFVVRGADRILHNVHVATSSTKIFRLQITRVSIKY